VQLDAVTAFVAPELLAVGEKKIRGFQDKEPRLRDYAHYLDDVLRRSPHTLGTAEERIVAQAGNLADAGQELHSIFTNADLPYPEIALASGDKVALDAAAYTRYRALPDRGERDKVFRAFWNAYSNFERTLGVALYAQVKAHVFNRDVRSFESCLDAALFDSNIPPRVYTQLLDDVHANLPTLHRYLRLRQRLLGVDALRYEDLYAPLVAKVDLTYTPEEGVALTLAACEPLGPGYVAAMKKGFESRWVDFMPSTGKRSGAYSQSVYGVHPYQLQNYMGRYDDVSTLAHEFGHSMHSYLADTNQPYVTHDYPIFVAEVASTLNENLLLDHMLSRQRDDATRLFLLGNYLETMRTTLFRQTLFAEFELRIHELAERGESLTGETMSALYLELARKYYGHAEGVCKVDDLYAIEWAYIPHFYYNFYVYQYATSLVASSSIASSIRAEAASTPPSTRARDAYVNMLAAGGSKYPIDLLRDAGVDMTTSAPFAAAMGEMNRVMDEIEAVLQKNGGKPGP
jgi:oligoendopeptidase F